MELKSVLRLLSPNLYNLITSRICAVEAQFKLFRKGFEKDNLNTTTKLEFFLNLHFKRS